MYNDTNIDYFSIKYRSLGFSPVSIFNTFVNMHRNAINLIKIKQKTQHKETISLTHVPNAGEIDFKTSIGNRNSPLFTCIPTRK